MSCFAAGMLLALALCHILPEAVEGFEELTIESELSHRLLEEDND